VVVTTASRTSIPVVLNGLGNVAAYYTVTVKSRVDGQLMNVDFKEGDHVQQGQVLAEIDPRPFQVQLDLAQATLARDQAQLKNAQLDQQSALVAQYEATIKQDQANIDNARLQLTYSRVTAPITGVAGLRIV